jgi:hypothetical protein
MPIDHCGRKTVARNYRHERARQRTDMAFQTPSGPIELIRANNLDDRGPYDAFEWAQANLSRQVPAFA